jgi:hypothetical protein
LVKKFAVAKGILKCRAVYVRAPLLDLGPSYVMESPLHPIPIRTHAIYAWTSQAAFRLSA